jgi:hypothetical protein
VDSIQAILKIYLQYNLPATIECRLCFSAQWSLQYLLEGKVGKVGKIGKVGRVGKVGKLGKEGRLRE